MTDLFTLSIIDSDLVHHEGFAFSMIPTDWIKFFLNKVFDSRGWIEKEIFIGSTSYFYEENSTFYWRIEKKEVNQNQYRLIQNLIQIQYSTYGYIRNKFHCLLFLWPLDLFLSFSTLFSSSLMFGHKSFHLGILHPLTHPVHHLPTQLLGIPHMG